MDINLPISYIIMTLEHLENNFDKAQYLQSLLVNCATGNNAENSEYQELRLYFLNNSVTKSLLPSWVITNRDLSQYWQYIKIMFSTYAERRTFIWGEFAPLLDALETGSKTPSDQTVSEVLKRFDAESIQKVWSKALDRRQSDPEGAITAARTLLETICKHILDEKGIKYTSKTDLPKLYFLVSTELNLAPSQFTEDVFKQILGSCSSIVSGLGTLRNKLGDAHGHGTLSFHPAARHAELAVNLAGSVALFLIETWESCDSNKKQ